MIDITDFIDLLFSLFLRIFSFIFTTLDSIRFWGFSLLEFIIGIAVIGAMVSVLFTFAPGTSKMVTSAVRDSRSRKGSDKDEK